MGEFKHSSEGRGEHPRWLPYLAVSLLCSALLSLPLAPHGPSPDTAAMMILASLALLLGHLWALPMAVLLAGAQLLIWAPQAWPSIGTSFVSICTAGTVAFALPALLITTRVGPVLAHHIAADDLLSRRAARVLIPLALVLSFLG